MSHVYEIVQNAQGRRQLRNGNGTRSCARGALSAETLEYAREAVAQSRQNILDPVVTYTNPDEPRTIKAVIDVSVLRCLPS